MYTSLVRRAIEKTANSTDIGPNQLSALCHLSAGRPAAAAAASMRRGDAFAGHNGAAAVITIFGRRNIVPNNIPRPPRPPPPRSAIQTTRFVRRREWALPRLPVGRRERHSPRVSIRRRPINQSAAAAAAAAASMSSDRIFAGVSHAVGSHRPRRPNGHNGRGHCSSAAAQLSVAADRCARRRPAGAYANARRDNRRRRHHQRDSVFARRRAGARGRRDSVIELKSRPRNNGQSYPARQGHSPQAGRPDRYGRRGANRDHKSGAPLSSAAAALFAAAQQMFALRRVGPGRIPIGLASDRNNGRRLHNNSNAPNRIAAAPIEPRRSDPIGRTTPQTRPARSRQRYWRSAATAAHLCGASPSTPQTMSRAAPITHSPAHWVSPAEAAEAAAIVRRAPRPFLRPIEMRH